MMCSARSALLALALLVIPTQTTAQDELDPAVQARAELLSTLLAEGTQKSHKGRVLYATVGIATGTTLAGLGAWRLSESAKADEFTRGLGVMFLSLAATELGTSIVELRHPHLLEETAAWWKDASADGVSEFELGRAEGLLSAAATSDNRLRKHVRWIGFAKAMAGAVVMGLMQIPDLNKRSRQSGYVVGALFIGTGAVAFGTSYNASPSEKAWKRYKAFLATAP